MSLPTLLIDLIDGNLITGMLKLLVWKMLEPNGPCINFGHCVIGISFFRNRFQYFRDITR